MTMTDNPMKRVFNTLCLSLSCIFLLIACDSGTVNDDGAALDGDIAVQLEAPEATTVGFTANYINVTENGTEVDSNVSTQNTGDDSEGKTIDLEDGHDGYLIQVTYNGVGPVTVTLLSDGEVLDTAQATEDEILAEVKTGAKRGF